MILQALTRYYEDLLSSRPARGAWVEIIQPLSIAST